MLLTRDPSHSWRFPLLSVITYGSIPVGASRRVMTNALGDDLAPLRAFQTRAASIFSKFLLLLFGAVDNTRERNSPRAFLFAIVTEWLKPSSRGQLIASLNSDLVLTSHIWSFV